MEIKEYAAEAVELLKRLIATPSVSRDEKAAADIMETQLQEYGFDVKREANNVWTCSPEFDEALPTVLLNAHIDTVKPVKSWTLEPFRPILKDGKLYGLGSNDCGGGLVSLLQTFKILSMKRRNFNLIYLASAEEEVSGKDGISRALPLLPKIDVAIVGEPTGMQPAVAEKGLMVLDVIARGKSGHAARNEGVNAIYEALDDIEWIRNYKFPKVSEFLGPVKMQLTVINAGTQHNVVPDECKMLVDVRTNELYSNEEVFEIIRNTCAARSWPILSVSGRRASMLTIRLSVVARLWECSRSGRLRSATRHLCRSRRLSWDRANHRAHIPPMSLSRFRKSRMR